MINILINTTVSQTTDGRGKVLFIERDSSILTTFIIQPGPKNLRYLQYLHFGTAIVIVTYKVSLQDLHKNTG